MKTTLDLPEELVREAKLRALMQGRTLRDLVTEVLRQGLGMAPVATPPPPTQDQPSVVVTGPMGLPVIRCRADAPAGSMGVRDLLALEQTALTADDALHAEHPV